MNEEIKWNKLKKKKRNKTKQLSAKGTIYESLDSPTKTVKLIMK
jgi:hypothetical protein